MMKHDETWWNMMKHDETWWNHHFSSCFIMFHHVSSFLFSFHFQFLNLNSAKLNEFSSQYLAQKWRNSWERVTKTSWRWSKRSWRKQWHPWQKPEKKQRSWCRSAWEQTLKGPKHPKHPKSECACTLEHLWEKDDLMKGFPLCSRVKKMKPPHNLCGWYLCEKVHL